jgi:hypothetical protein
MGVRRLMTAALFAAATLALPAAAKAQGSVPEGFYGVTWDRATTRAPEADQAAQFALMASTGVETVRTVFRWSEIERNPSQPPDFTGTDRLVALASSNDISVLPVVSYTPAWAALDPTLTGSTPRDVDDYVAFIEQLVRRYGPEGTFWLERPDLPTRPLREWQIWNEPHLQEYWDTGDRGRDAWAREYAQLLKAASRRIRELDPGATVVLAGLADFVWLHLRRLARFRIGRFYDVAALNFFTSRPHKVLKGVRLFRAALRRSRMSRKPLWLTEVTWPAAKGRVARPGPLWQRKWWVTDSGMARRVRDLYSLAARASRRHRLRRVYWYTWASGYDNGDLFDYTGLTRYANGTYEPMPALRAYAASARRHQR